MGRRAHDLVVQDQGCVSFGDKMVWVVAGNILCECVCDCGDHEKKIGWKAWEASRLVEI
jgi:hypothetical protein